ncbi:MAG: GNAT family N-acetyltransferase [Candidatus Hodarchaeota archaeon]
MEDNLTVSEMQKDDLQFLFKLWHNPDVMRYADEFPRMRGWSKSDEPQTAWRKYQQKRTQLGYDYTQLILRLSKDTPIGESFFFPLPEAYTFGKWSKSDNVKSFMGDIKLLPQYWGKSLGSKGMCLVVNFVFSKTDCELFVVPPHRLNPAAYRVYENVGFVLFTGMRSWRNHKIMELSKEQYKKIYLKK